MSDKLIEAAQAVVDRWDSPLWKDAEPTAAVINRLREAIAALSAKAENGRDDFDRPEPAKPMAERVQQLIAEFDLSYTHPGDLLRNGAHNLYCTADALESLINSITATLTAEHEAQLAAKDAEIARLKRLLIEAAGDLADWGSYVPEYFVEKHKLDDDIQKYRQAGSARAAQEVGGSGG